MAVAANAFPSVSLHGEIHCTITITIGVSAEFASIQALDAAMQQADVALYRGKASGRNRVEWAFSAAQPGTDIPTQAVCD